MIAAYLCVFLIGQNGTRNLKTLGLKTITVLLSDSKRRSVCILYVISTIDDLMDRLLSISQFTLEWVFIGAAVSVAFSVLSVKEN